MKTCIIPLSILGLFLLFSLLTGSFVHRSCTQWISELETISTLADTEQWERAEHSLSDIMQDWQRHERVYHMVLEHRDLSDAKELFLATMAAFHATDQAESQINLQLLISQLQFIADSQRVSLKNLL